MLNGFMYSLHLPLFKLKFMSRKSITFLFVSILTFSLCSVNILHTCFFVFSMVLGVALQAESLSSLYCPIVFYVVR